MNILCQKLGFTDKRVLADMLLKLWRSNYRLVWLGNATDEQMAKVADDFLEKRGRGLWSIEGRGPLYPGDKDKVIKPIIIQILHLQCQNQIDVKAGKRWRQRLSFDDSQSEEVNKDDKTAKKRVAYTISEDWTSNEADVKRSRLSRLQLYIHAKGVANNTLSLRTHHWKS